MQKVLLAFTTILIISCSAPREIVKSKDLSPNCHCEGEGNYTIVMEAGMGNWSLFYQPVFQELKKTTKVCIIDRAGYAMDAVSSNPRDAKTIAFEIEKALVQNRITDSIILVGHSLGGLHVRMYQSLFPEKVKGMILLDAAHPNQFDRLPKAFQELQNQQAKSVDKVIKLAQKDYLKYSKGKIPTFGIPDSLLANYYKVTTQPEYYYSMKMEVLEFENSLNQVENLNDLGSLPLLVIGSNSSMEEAILPGKLKNYPFEEHNKIWLELQKELSQLSSNSTFIESNQNHYLNITDNELVVEQIVLFMNQNFKVK
jgi:pimeloyl-ACP methyl ester carboxylesterase